MRLLQITDLHLKADPRAHIQGKIIRESLDATLQAAFENTGEEPELIVITGDIADEEKEQDYTQAYRYLKKRLQAFGGKIRCIPGNHDFPQLLYRCFGPQVSAGLVADNWQLIFLDSYLRGALGGKLDNAQLEAIRKSQGNGIAEHTLLFLHHPPVSIGSRWLDLIKLENADEFIDLITQYSDIKGVVFGHAHQEFESEIAGIRIMGTPAASPRQFLPGADEFRVDTQASPGFRWLTLHPNGRLESQVVRV